MHENLATPMKVGTMASNLTTVADNSAEQEGNRDDSTELECKQFHNNAGQRLLHLFSGPHHRKDGFAAAVERRGRSCAEYDLVNGPHEDLTNDAIWSELLAKIRSGHFDGLLSGPPCNTFTNARKDDGVGPLPLKGPAGDERYGLDDWT